MEKFNRQFGIWMDRHHAMVVGNHADGSFSLLGHIANSGAGTNSSENAQNHLEITLLHKYFKEITSFIKNAQEIFVTGTGQIQEQFIHHLAETPQFKNSRTSHSTTVKMDEAKFLDLVISHFKSVIYSS